MITATRRLPYVLQGLKRVLLYGIPLEIAVLAGVWALYIGLWLPADMRYIPHALEHERLSGVLLPAEISLKTYGRIPTWNPYIGSGTPTLNNPFNYLFNPFASLPVLLFGGVSGSKIATATSLLLAAVNMWALARAIGLGSAARVLAGALYMLSGGLAGKFYIGHFQLALSLAWPPLVLAGLWWTLHSHHRRAPLLMAAAFALLFFTGNIYYTLHTLICAAVMTLSSLFTWKKGEPIQFQVGRLQRVMVGAVFALGLSLVQFMPVLAISDSIYHGEDPGLASRYALDVAFGNYTTPWEAWFPQENLLGGLIGGVDYAYIGLGVFALIGLGTILLIFPAIRRNITSDLVRAALISGFLGLFMTVWGAGQTGLIQWLYANIPLLSEFRFTGRALAVGGMWWILLAVMAFEVLIRAAGRIMADEANRSRMSLIAAGVCGVIVSLWFYLYSIGDSVLRLAFALRDLRLFNTLNERRWADPVQATEGFWAVLAAAILLVTAAAVGIRVVQRRLTRRQFSGYLLHTMLIIVAISLTADLMRTNRLLFKYKLSEYDYGGLYAYARSVDTDSPFPIINEAFSPLSYATYYNRVRNWGLNEGWIPAALPGIIPPEAGTLSYLPRWTMVGEWAVPLEEKFALEGGYSLRFCVALGSTSAALDPCPPHQERTVYLYELADALPYAYLVPKDALLTRPAALRAGDVIPVNGITHEIDTITFDLDVPQTGTERYTLVVQETHFPGWDVRINGAETAHYGVGHFIGLDVPEGHSTIRLHYEPPGFLAGLAGSLLTSLAMVAWLVKGWLSAAANSEK